MHPITYRLMFHMPHLVAFAYGGQLSCNNLTFGECLQMSLPEKSDLVVVND
jgi:hypothetical protein